MFLCVYVCINIYETIIFLFGRILRVVLTIRVLQSFTTIDFLTLHFTPMFGYIFGGVKFDSRVELILLCLHVFK